MTLNWGLFGHAAARGIAVGVARSQPAMSTQWARRAVTVGAAMTALGGATYEVVSGAGSGFERMRSTVVAPRCTAPVVR